MSDPTTPVLTDYDRKLIEAYRAFREHGTENAAARALGVNRTTMTNRLLRYFTRGLDGSLPMDIPPGQVVKGQSRHYDADGHLVAQHVKTGLAPSEDVFEVPSGHRVKGESALVNAQGEVVQKWVKTTEGERSDEQIAEAARIAAERYVRPAEPMILTPERRAEIDPKLLNYHHLPDLHIGLHAHPATAQTAWDLETSIVTYRRLFRLLIERSPRAQTGVLLGGGDLLHYDDPTRMTRRSGNVLDGAEPYEVVLAEAEMLMVYKVELMLEKYPEVLVRILKGNHDEDSAVAVSHFLAAWFRNEPRVTVDIDPGLVWVHQHGRVMLGATHGHEVRISELPGVMSADHRKMWGDTDFAYAHGYHVHHRTKGTDTAGNGTPYETHETPVPRDAYHQGKGYRGPQSLSVITYHSEAGETGRTQEALIL